MLKQWYKALKHFVLDTVRLQNLCSIPYLMMINSVFCMVCFWCNREVQLRTLYTLIGFLFLSDLILIERQQNPLVLAFLFWVFHDFLRSFSICLFAFSVYALNEGHEQKAFLGSLCAVCSLVISPFYHHQKINEKLLHLLHKAVQTGKQFLYSFVVRPLLFAWDWLKYLLLLRWISVIRLHIRSWVLVIWDWLDASVFAPLFSFGRKVKALMLYVLLFRWCVDVWRLTRRLILRPLGVQLSRLLDAFVYVFGCYWLKPMLMHIARATGRMIQTSFRWLGHLSLTLISLAFEHILWPLLFLFADQLELFGLFLHEKAIRPCLAILYRKYKILEDLMLINVLGPILKTFLDWLPKRNPFEVESDHELDEFIPEFGVNDDSGEFVAENDTTLTTDLHDYALTLAVAESEPTSGRRSSLSSLFSLEEEAKALTTGLRHIDIGESDSDTEVFLPGLRRHQ